MPLLLRSILPYLGILFIIQISKSLSKRIHDKNNCLLLISYSSYTIYLYHTTFQGFIKALIYKLPLDHSYPFIFTIEAVITIAIGILGPIILYKYVLNRWKVTRFLFGV